MLLNKLDALIGRHRFNEKNSDLNSILERRLGDKTVEEALKEFLAEAENYKGKINYQRLTERDFFSLVNNQSEKLRDTLTFLYREMANLPKADENIFLRYRSKEIGFEYHLKKHPRNKKIGLFGIYPAGDAHIALGLEGWQELNISESTLNELANFPRKVQSKEWAKGLIVLLKTAIKEIKSHT